MTYSFESLHLRFRPAGRQIGHHLPNECLPTDKHASSKYLRSTGWR